MDLELRPSARRVRTVMVTAGLVFVLVTTIAGGVVGLLISLALCVVGLSVGYAYLRRSRIVVTATEIAMTGFRIRRRPLSEVTSVVRTTVVPVRDRVQPTLFLRGAGDRVVLRIRADHYETDDLDLLVRRIGRPAIEHDRPMTAAPAGRRAPRHRAVGGTAADRVRVRVRLWHGRAGHPDRRCGRGAVRLRPAAVVL